jgi:hypothetical protein
MTVDIQALLKRLKKEYSKCKTLSEKQRIVAICVWANNLMEEENKGQVKQYVRT